MSRTEEPVEGSDTEETTGFVLRVTVVTLAGITLIVAAALAMSLFVDSREGPLDRALSLLGPAFNLIIGAFVGLVGGVSLKVTHRKWGSKS